MSPDEIERTVEWLTEDPKGRRILADWLWPKRRSYRDADEAAYELARFEPDVVAGAFGMEDW